MTITQVSELGNRFILGHEGLTTTAYKDVGGVVTIYGGLTMSSAVFADWWRSRHAGRALQVGDRITPEDGAAIFQRVLDIEYGPPVAAATLPATQHEMDGSLSATYNFGIGGLKWAWAPALKSGAIERGAELLRHTATSVHGVYNAALAKRRGDEATLIETGNYMAVVPIGSDPPPHVSTSPSSVKDYQGMLSQLGYYAGSIDGAPGELTTGAVKNFQRDNNMLVDGKVGPATRATMARQLQAKTRNKTVAAVAGVGAVGSTQVHGLPLDSTLTMALVAIGLALVVFIAFLIWHNRGRLTGKRTPS